MLCTIISLLICVFLYKILTNKVEHFTFDKKKVFESDNDVKWCKVLSKKESQTLLTSFDDGFLEKLGKSPINLHVRRIKTVDEYVEKIQNEITYGCREISEKIINDSINYIQNIPINLPWLDEKKFKAMPWVVCVTDSSSLYEEGYPHTRFSNAGGHCIIIPKHAISTTKNFVILLLHEQMHNYQRKYNTEFNEWLYSSGWSTIKHDTQSHRINPDALINNDMLWQKDGNVHLCRFLEDDYGYTYPSLSNVEFEPKPKSSSEHPNECYAYKDSEKIIG
jgi:hypothetical protein